MTISNRTQSTDEPNGQIAWATSSIGNEPNVTIEALQKGLTVDLIATKRSSFETCAHDEMLSTVVERNRHNGFDFCGLARMFLRPALPRVGIFG
jgi:hypothetical protein